MYGLICTYFSLPFPSPQAQITDTISYRPAPPSLLSLTLALGRGGVGEEGGRGKGEGGKTGKQVVKQIKYEFTPIHSLGDPTAEK